MLNKFLSLSHHIQMAESFSNRYMTNAELATELRNFKSWLETPLAASNQKPKRVQNDSAEEVSEPKKTKKAKKTGPKVPKGPSSHKDKRETKKSKAMTDDTDAGAGASGSSAESEAEAEAEPESERCAGKKRAKEAKTDEQEVQETFVHNRGKKQKKIFIKNADSNDDGTKPSKELSAQESKIERAQQKLRGGPRF